MKTPKIDELDLKIIKILQEDVRTSFQDISNEIGISISDLSFRYKKLCKAGVIKGATILPDFSKIGGFFIAIVGITTKYSETNTVLQHINKMIVPGVAVSTFPTFGRFTILAYLTVNNVNKIHEFTKKAREHPSILGITTSISISWLTPYENLDLNRAIER